MCAISRALMTAPTLPVVDEMGLGLAPVVVDLLLDVLVRVRNQGTTVLLVEQDVFAAFSIADRAYVTAARPTPTTTAARPTPTTTAARPTPTTTAARPAPTTTAAARPTPTTTTAAARLTPADHHHARRCVRARSATGYSYSSSRFAVRVSVSIQAFPYTPQAASTIISPTSCTI
jgi:energy-coupling factor transporter ATP-binding protein EcfA2